MSRLNRVYRMLAEQPRTVAELCRLDGGVDAGTMRAVLRAGEDRGLLVRAGGRPCVWGLSQAEDARLWRLHWAELSPEAKCDRLTYGDVSLVRMDGGNWCIWYDSSGSVLYWTVLDALVGEMEGRSPLSQVWWELRNIWQQAWMRGGVAVAPPEPYQPIGGLT